MWPKNLYEVTDDLEKLLNEGHPGLFQPISTGIKFIDDNTGGGCRGGDLWLLGSVPNIGKTAAIMNIAQQVANNGDLAVIICYEHTELDLYGRLLLGSSHQNGKPFTKEELNQAYQTTMENRKQILEANDNRKGALFDYAMDKLDSGTQTSLELSKIGNNIWLVWGDSIYTDPNTIEKYVELASQYNKRSLFIIDYMQEIPLYNMNMNLTEKQEIAYIIKYLKSISMRAARDGQVAPILAVSSVDEESLKKGRVHFEDFMGDSKVQFTADVGIVMNYYEREDPTKEGYKVVWGIGKNRHGPNKVEAIIPYIGPFFTHDFENAKQIDFKDGYEKDKYKSN
jgi:replicative DNA helicase